MGRAAFRKVVFNLPIPRYNSKIKLHRDLATAAERAEGVAAAVPLPEGVKFQRARALVRSALTEAGISERSTRWSRGCLTAPEATHNISDTLSILVHVERSGAR